MAADDERRAEIEAEAAKALRERFGRLGILSRAVVYHHPSGEEIARVVLDAADRVRDARSDDEAGIEDLLSFWGYSPDADGLRLLKNERDDAEVAEAQWREKCHRAEERAEHAELAATEIARAAPSPSRDGSVAVEEAIDALDSIEGYAQRLSDDKGWGATRRCIQEEARKVREFLAEFSPASGDREEKKA